MVKTINLYNNNRPHWSLPKQMAPAIFEGYVNKLSKVKRPKGFQVIFSSRMHNGTENPAEIYYSNGGELNLNTNKVTPEGGLTESHAAAMNMKANLLPDMKLEEASTKVVASANTGADPLTSAHMRNWMECIRSRKPANASEEAGYSHSIATIMTNAAARTGAKVTFDEQAQEVMANGKVFKY
jgi:hypothetical protein